MSKLLARAKVKRANAENNYYNISLDDAYLDDCCYNLQQSIELCLKYIIEMNGENYIESHDLRAQMNKLKSINATIPSYDKLRFMATTLNSWEAESRYNDNFTALIEDVQDARVLADDLINYCDKLVEEIK